MANESPRGPVSRRKWLQATAAGSAGLLAGCNQGGGPDTTTTTETQTEGTETGETGTDTTTQKQFISQPFRRGMGQPNLLELEMAPQGASYWEEFASVFMAESGRLSLTTNEYVLASYGDYNVDRGNDELHITFREGSHWHRNGEILADLTGEDLVFKQEFNRLLTPEESRSETPIFTEWRSDGRTAIGEFNTAGGGYNAELAIPGVVQDYIVDHYRDGMYADSYQSLQDASSSDERKRIRTQVTEMTASVDEKPLSGAWLVDQPATQRITFDLDKDHWVADHINFDRTEVRSITGSGNAGYAACRADQVDTCGVPTTVADAPDYIKQVVSEKGDGGGQAFIVPYGSPAPEVFWKDPVVAAKTRQAIAHSFSKQVATNNQYAVPEGAERPSRGTLVEKPHQLHTATQAREVFGDELYEQWPEYQKDQARSAELLRDAGFTKDGGTWYKPNGDPFQFDIVMIGWQKGIVQTIQTALTDMGVQASTVNMGGQQFIQSYWDQREYQSIVAEKGPEFGPPSLHVAWWWDPTREATILPPGFEGRDASYQSYPMPPVGQFDAEPTEEVNPLEMVQTFNSTPEADLKEEITRLCWMSAYHLPVYPIHFFPQSFGLNTRHFQHPQPAPEFQSKWGNNFGIATADHNPVFSVEQNRHYIMRGIGGEVGDAPMLAKEGE